MLSFFYNNEDQLIAVCNYRSDEAKTLRGMYTEYDRFDFKTFEYAQRVAEEATKFANGVYIPTDAGTSVYPRFDVQRAPQVGDEVSRGFNGDYYPAGKIAKISKTMKKITTDTGETFYRVRQSGGWKSNGTWWMVAGHHNDKNPHF